MAAVDEAASEPSLGLGKLVEMDPRGVLIEPRRKLVLRFLHGDAIDVIDPLADRVIVEAVAAAGANEIVSGDIDARAGVPEHAWHHRLRQPRHMIAWRLRRRVALAQ